MKMRTSPYDAVFAVIFVRPDAEMVEWWVQRAGIRKLCAALQNCIDATIRSASLSKCDYQLIRGGVTDGA